MDWLETFLPFVLLALYFLSMLRKQSRQAQRQAPPSAAEEVEAPRAPTPFEELILQIQKASAEAQATAQPPPLPPPAAPPRRPTPKPPPLPVPASPTLTSEFHAVGGFEHERHGFGPESPFSEEAFARLPRGADVTAHAPGHLERDPHGLFRRPEAAAPSRRHPLVARLRAPGAARDAFALREILDAPRARRPR